MRIEADGGDKRSQRGNFHATSAPILLRRRVVSAGMFLLSIKMPFLVLEFRVDPLLSTYKNSFIRHLTDNYANSPRGIFGTIKINEIISKNIQEFIPLNPFDKIIKRVKYIFYSNFRINLKNLFKNNNLHPDLIKK